MRDNIPGGSKKWGVPVSAALGYALKTFTCDNFEDSKLLRNILNKFVSFIITILFLYPSF